MTILNYNRGILSSPFKDFSTNALPLSPIQVFAQVEVIDNLDRCRFLVEPTRSEEQRWSDFEILEAGWLILEQLESSRGV
jgi:hypothetical protein